MAAPSLGMTQCRSCGQTIFADAKSCQFCGSSNGSAVATKPGALPKGYVSEETATEAGVWLKVCAWFWIIHNVLLLVLLVAFKNHLDSMHAADARIPGGNNLFFFLGLVIVLAFLSVTVGMFSKSPASLRWAFVLSCFGSFFWTLDALVRIAHVFQDGSPRAFASAIFMCIAATMTYVTRWAVKRV